MGHYARSPVCRATSEKKSDDLENLYGYHQQLAMGYSPVKGDELEKLTALFSKTN